MGSTRTRSGLAVAMTLLGLVLLIEVGLAGRVFNGQHLAGIPPARLVDGLERVVVRATPGLRAEGRALLAWAKSRKLTIETNDVQTERGVTGVAAAV